jgi:hypothetical protein
MRNAIVFGFIGLGACLAVMRLLPSDTPDAPLAEAPRPSSPALRARPAHTTDQPPASAQLVADTRAEPAVFRDAADGELSIDDSRAPEPADDRVAGLVGAGFTPHRAAEILRLEAELRRDAYLAEYEASGTIRPLNSAARAGSVDRLRSQLGDDDYERYLAGTGQPRSVVVRVVDASSAAAHAGLLPGDEILAYAGQRVFNQRDLNGLMLAGTPGEVVPATVVRNGQTLQLYVTRGPLGLM